ncbi:hypothetical protein EJ04DRAFT_511372 [Polyplosphaeria fusca]|uniref:Uncharacterized protein n=1 Tax=Polyplosphaeria fusca TaxID=682080 RepID=A0A9P4V2T3_9PLEO|nr:hypothetical protein EJ04DRAFT_511372 [Polyplosphaeria fusca]
MESSHGEPPNEYASSRSSRLRLKTERRSRAKKRRSNSRHDEYYSSHAPRHHRSDTEETAHEHKSRRRHHKHHKHGKSHKTGDPNIHSWDGDYVEPERRHRESLYDGVGEAHQQNVDAAFQESLFDALADDEGADYWEGVYGQPIHIYSNTRPGPDGELERMNDDEYADYVRKKMWEKSHQHILEEREARARERSKQKKKERQREEETAQLEEERENTRRRMEESLARGEERKRAREIEGAWTLYVEKWETLRNYKGLDQGVGTKIERIIPWPVVSGSIKHVSKENIEFFFQHSSAWRQDPVATLKVERVRWHPDKMQQRFGQHIDVNTMKSMTAVFQVVDRLWNEHRR